MHAVKTPIPPIRTVLGNARFLNTLLIRLVLCSSVVAVLYLLLVQRDLMVTNIQMRFLYSNQREFFINFKNIHLPYWMELPGANNPACPLDTKLLILIMTRRGAFSNRVGIRHTWLQDALNGTVTRFLIADAHEPQLPSTMNEQSQLEQEQLLYKDLIFQHGIEDSYANLHLKWLAGLHWQQAFCPQTQWLMKTDDDTIVHLPRLNHWMEQKFHKELEQNAAAYFGHVIAGVGPIREKGHKWYVPESAYPGKWYPTYMQGATYIATEHAISSIIPHMGEVNGFNMDDVLFTGVLADLGNVSKWDHKEMFRKTTWPNEKELCGTGGVPFVTALYGANSFERFRDIYAKMNSIKCG